MTELTARRPDIEDIELSCDNTDALIPYVDLVNEILAYRVAGTSPTAPIQAQGTSDDLLAAPHISPAHTTAFSTLSAAPYPWSLPFHYWQDEARIFLGYLGTSRADLMRAMQTSTPFPTDLQIAQETLGMSKEERLLITGASSSTTQQAWGTSSGTWTTDLLRATAFLDRSRLSFTELRELLDTKLMRDAAVSAQPVLVEDSETDPCNIDNLSISGLTGGSLATTWDSVHRLTRVSRRLGWTLSEVDKALFALSETLDDSFIQSLAHIQRLRQETGADVSVLEAMSWWGSLDVRRGPTLGTPSFYDQYFFSKQLDNPPDPDLDPDTFAGNLADKVDAILAGTGLSGADYALLTDSTAAGALALTTVTSGTNVSLANLSVLYRNASFARAFAITVPEVRILTALTGTRGLSLPTFATLPSTTRLWVERLHRIQASGLSIAEAHYLVRHVVQPAVGLKDPSAEIETFLTQLGVGYEAIAVAVVSKPDATGDRLLTMLQDLVGVGDVPNDAREEVVELMHIVRDTSTSGTPELIIDAALDFLDTAVRDSIKTTLLGIGGTEVTDVALRIDDLQEKLATYVIDRDQRGFATQAVADYLGVPPSLLRDLMSWITDADSTGDLLVDLLPSGLQETDSRSVHALVKLRKAALLIDRLELSHSDCSLLNTHGATLGWFVFDDLPAEPPNSPSTETANYAKLERWMDFVYVRDRIKSGKSALANLIGAAHAATPPSFSDHLDAISGATGWSRSQLEFLTASAQLDLDTVADFKDEKPFLKLQSIFELLQKTGAEASEAWAWLDVDAPFTGTPIAASVAGAGARKLARAKHTPESWTKTSQRLREPLRERERDALVGYMLNHPTEPVASIEALYGQLLVDPEMAACQLTSRIVQATASVQLFIQRIFLNLETGLTLGEEASRAWKWMKNYRVWEAGRKVLLYPENWILPELRDDKSPLFQRLESDLRQGELNDELIDSAYGRYLQGLKEVADLDVVALMPVYATIASQRDYRPTVVHLLARSRSAPVRHYYRQRNEFEVWSPWERLDLDIPHDNVTFGETVRGIYLAWPSFFEKPLPHSQQAPGNPPNNAGEPTKTEYEITLNVAERTASGWRPAEEAAGSKPTIPGIFKNLEPSFYTRLIHRTDGILELHAPLGPIAGWAQGLGGAVLGRTTDPKAFGLVQIASVKNGHKVGSFTAYGQDRATVDPENLYLWYQGYHHAYHMTADGFDVASYGANAHLYVIGHREHAWSASDGTYEPIWQTRSVVRNGYHQFFISAFPPDPVIADPVDSAIYNAQLTVTPQPPFDGQSYDRPAPVLTYAASPPQESVVVTASKFAPSFRFEEFTHPYASYILEQYLKHGVEGVHQYDTSAAPQKQLNSYFDSIYAPRPVVETPYPAHRVDFALKGAYALYNWEVFFHVPFLISKRLLTERRYEQALQWIGRIFDPTSKDSSTSPQQFWKVKPFQTHSTMKAMLEARVSFDVDSEPDVAEATALMQPDVSSDPAKKKALNHATQHIYDMVEAWRREPFNPHLLARYRPNAYMKATVMLYLDILVGWGDELFRRDTMESINEATQLYVLAREILGPRPLILDHQEVSPVTYATYDPDDEPAVGMENLAPKALTFDEPNVSSPATISSDLSYGFPPSLLGLGCVPPNERLLKYWDTVDDRLFKIHHCMNIEGIVRQLPLFAPPIDPAVLVAAAAAGVDISSVLSDIMGPLPRRRFRVLFAKATEAAKEAASLGGALLSALEKRDGEQLSRLRQTHERAALELGRDVRERAVEEAKEQIRALEQTLDGVRARRDYFSLQASEKVKQDELNALDLSEQASAKQDKADSEMFLAKGMYKIPDIGAGGAGSLGTPLSNFTIGGSLMGAVAEVIATNTGNQARRLRDRASTASQLATYARRQEDWENQLEQAQIEYGQVGTQISAARLRLAMAELELRNHKNQEKQAKETDTFLRTKFTRLELYADWMLAQVSETYYQTYKLAYDYAKLAERAYRFERAESSTNFISFGYWDGGKKGLSAGDKLMLDLRRMEKSFEETEPTQYEITKTVSLAQHDPEKLLTIMRSGSTDVAEPIVIGEEAFDSDYPGHYLRRLRSVSIDIPVVAGPHTGVHATLRLMSNKIRKDPSSAGTYAETGVDDRFLYEFGRVDAICTSSGYGESGRFELSFGTDRYQPFEGAGAISKWALSLPMEDNKFDLRSMGDIVLRLQYSSREGGDILRGIARPWAAGASNTVKRLVRLHEEFAVAWETFVGAPNSSGMHVLAFDLSDDMMPYQAGTDPHLVESLKLELVWALPGDEHDNVEVATPVHTLEEPSAGPGLREVIGTSSATYRLEGKWKVRIPTSNIMPVAAFLIVETKRAAAATAEDGFDFANADLRLNPTSGGTIVDGRISSWDATVSSGSATFTQSTVANRPYWQASALNGRPGVQFVSADQTKLTSSASAGTYVGAGAFTAWLVVRIDAFNGTSSSLEENDTAFGDGGNWALGNLDSSAPDIGVALNGSERSARGSVAVGEVVLLRCRLDGGELSSGINGAAGIVDVDPASNVASFGNLQMGQGSVTYGDLVVGEVLVYKSAVSTQVEADADEYFIAKYNLPNN